MIYEIAVLPIHKERIDLFRQAFADVAPLLRRAKGYGGHLLAQGIESPERFNLIVKWRSLEDHSPGFEASEDHRVFMLGLENYFSEHPTVYHIEGAAFTPVGLEHPDGAAGSNGAEAPDNAWLS